MNRALVVKDASKSEIPGLRPGSVLFVGVKDGAWYSGRVYDPRPSCVPEPPAFDVEGPVLQGPLRIELEGNHDIYEGCSPTGQTFHDVLIITYDGIC